jgi:hypothetical protein
MSQYDFGNLSSPLSGTTFFDTHLEAWRDALHSNHSGTSQPSYIATGGHWLDTTSTSWVLNYYDGAADIAAGTIDTTNNIFINTRYMPAGSAAAPGVSFSGDTDTGLFSHAANVMGLATGGGARVYFSSNGVAINTPTFVSQSQLTVNGSISVNAADADFASGGGRALIDFATSVARIGSVNGGGSATTTQILSNNSTAISIDSSQNVGVGSEFLARQSASENNYIRGQSFLWIIPQPSAPSGTTTLYTCGNALTTDGSLVNMPMPVGADCIGMYIYANSGPSPGTNTITVMKNGVATAISAVVSGTAGYTSYTASSVTFGVNDRIGLRYALSSAGASWYHVALAFRAN